MLVRLNLRQPFRDRDRDLHLAAPGFGIRQLNRALHRVGDAVRASDYVAPPLLLSSEETGSEVTWSAGRYMPAAEVWKSFALEGPPPDPYGVFANQPSPYSRRAGRYWRAFLWLFLALMVLMTGRCVTADGEQVFDQQFSFMPKPGAEAALADGCGMPVSIV